MEADAIEAPKRNAAASRAPSLLAHPPPSGEIDPVPQDLALRPDRVSVVP